MMPVTREEAMAAAERLREEAMRPGLRWQLPFEAGQVIAFMLRLLDERTAPVKYPVPPVMLTKKEDDPAGILRISAGGKPNNFYYCVIRGPLDPIVECLDGVMIALKNMQRVTKHPPNCPDCGMTHEK